MSLCKNNNSQLRLLWTLKTYDRSNPTNFSLLSMWSRLDSAQIACQDVSEMQEPKLEQTQEAIENHHPDKKHEPKLTVRMTRKEHQELHHKLPIDTPLARQVRQYIMLTKIVQVTKNWRIAYKKEFDQDIPIDVSAIVQGKRQKRKQIAEMIIDERQKIPTSKGLRDMLLAKVLAFAHPIRFSTCRRFLHYCGFTQSAKLSKKYRRDVHSTGYQMAVAVVMAKHPKYYPLYKTIKEQLLVKHPNYSKSKVDGMTKTRIATLVLKDIYISLVVERS